MPTATRILLVRHGETDDNLAQVFQGQGGRGLNARGREQAAKLALRLAGLSPPGSGHLGALYTSDLERAQETAAILGRAVGLDPLPDPELREVFLGAWQGLSFAEVSARFPEEWAAWQRGEDVRRGAGETYADLGARMERALDRIAAAHPGVAVAVVSHGAAIKILVARVLGLGVAGLRAFRVADNTGVSVVELRAGGRGRLLVWNDVGHLHDAVGDALARRA